MKRFANTLLSDIRYQWRYGFYFIYAFMTAVFIVILRILPESWRQTALVLTLLSDPALLGFFFIGGILQLERGEGILDALFSTPLRPWEYIAAKALSLGTISTLAGVLIGIGSGIPGIRFALLIPAMLFSSVCFTFIGISASVNLKSMNAFLSVDGMWEALLLFPPLLLLMGIAFAPLEVFPGSIALRLMQASAGLPVFPAGYAAGLAIWLAGAFLLAHRRLRMALTRLGGGAS